ncbi:hypothetical protein V7S43_007112 [Phytophthora oleae]|uniref:TRP C-terminal domain-containing protein n=1 Tax=Phytophthora oleae TaxID=2107226 RepID=A0ABD3FLE4_9STRA
MTVIQPSPVHQQLSSRLSQIKAGLAKGYHRWQTLQVSYRGHKYSVERLLALDEYTRTTSPVRVTLVVCGTLAPMVVLVISQESIPLNDPTEGWRANYGFWVRVGVMAGIVSCTLAVQANSIIHTAAITPRHLILLGICLSLSYPFISMGIAAFVGFPIPFFALSTIPIFFLLLILWFSLIIGRNNIRKMFQKSDEMQMFVKFICAQMLLPVVYPIYEVLFSAASNTYFELPVIILLSIMKVLMKNVIAVALVGMEDKLPEAVILTVDFFHAVYLTTCMQSTRSAVTLAIIITVDGSQSIFMLLGLHRRSQVTLIRAKRAAGMTSNTESLVTLLHLICSSSDKLTRQNLSGIQVNSCLHHTLDRPSRNLLNRMKKLLQSGSVSRKSSRSSSSAYGSRLLSSPIIPLRKLRFWIKLSGWRQHANSIQPFSPTFTFVQPSPGRVTARKNNSLVFYRSNILRDGLQALFTSECLVLASYLHTSIAMFYATFIVVMVYLPSARYHTELRGVTRENVAATVESVFIFGAFEFVSFALLAVMMRHKYGMNAFYQLAFVLETQVTLIQSKVMMWMLIILAFRVVHFGVDFTLRFAWI